MVDGRAITKVVMKVQVEVESTGGGDMRLTEASARAVRDAVVEELIARSVGGEWQDRELRDLLDGNR